MSGDSCRVEQSSNGVKGLAMMAPFVGAPVLFHALTGAVVSGLGFATIATALTPFKDDLLKAAKSLANEMSANLGSVSAPTSSSKPVHIAATSEGGDIPIKNESISVSERVDPGLRENDSTEDNEIAG